jgi:hypothetical protein
MKTVSLPRPLSPYFGWLRVACLAVVPLVVGCAADMGDDDESAEEAADDDFFGEDVEETTDVASGLKWSNYTFTYALDQRFASWTPQQMVSVLNRNFDGYFTYRGCGKKLVVGRECRLRVPGGPDGPIRVTRVGRDRFSFLSLKGHPEGANRTIVFSFVKEQGRMKLRVQASGKASRLSRLGPLNSWTVARGSWSIFKRNINGRFPARP